jgi:hypothetical protein
MPVTRSSHIIKNDDNTANRGRSQVVLGFYVAVLAVAFAEIGSQLLQRGHVDFWQQSVLSEARNNSVARSLVLPIHPL